MQAFKVFLKIFQRYALPMIIMYTAICVGLSVVKVKFAEPISDSFEATKCKVAIINNDNSELSQSLTDYIYSRSKKVEIEEDEESLKDAIFYSSVDYALIIPEGFGQSFFEGEPLTIENMQIPNSAKGFYMTSMVNSYLSSVRLFYDGTGVVDYAKLAENLSLEAEISFGGEKTNDEVSSLTSSMNFLAYPLIAIMTYSIPVLFIVLNQLDLKRRNACSPINYTKFNMQLILGNVLFTFVIYLLFVAMTFILFGADAIMQTGNMIMLLNALIFSLTAMSLAFLVASLTKKLAVASAVSNVASLGSAFLSGAFVAQDIMSEGVKNVAVLNPAFWYVKANDTLASLTNFTFETMKPVLYAMLIEVAFTAVFLSVSLVVVKLRRQSE